MNLRYSRDRVTANVLGDGTATPIPNEPVHRIGPELSAAGGEDLHSAGEDFFID